jgi:hypothetical protein
MNDDDDFFYVTPLVLYLFENIIHFNYYIQMPVKALVVDLTKH